MRLIPASTARSKTRRASSSEDVTPFRLVCDAPNVIAPSESALTRNPEVPSLRNSTDRSPEVNCGRILYRHNRPNMSNTLHDRLTGGRTDARRTSRDLARSNGVPLEPVADFRWAAATFRTALEAMFNPFSPG